MSRPTPPATFPDVVACIGHALALERPYAVTAESGSSLGDREGAYK